MEGTYVDGNQQNWEQLATVVPVSTRDGGGAVLHQTPSARMDKALLSSLANFDAKYGGFA